MRLPVDWLYRGNQSDSRRTTRALANAHWPELRDLLAQSERSVEELPCESGMSADFEKGVDQGSRAALYLIMGGTVAKLTDRGLRVLFIDLCNGEPADYAEPGVRAGQAMRAAAILSADRAQDH